MDGIFGIGIPEILIVLALALIILGPQDMVSTARKLGRWVYQVYHSPTWRTIMSTSQEIRQLPTKFVREAGLEDTVEDFKNTTANVKAQLKEVTGDVSAELKDVTREATGEMREARQELGAGAEAAAAGVSEPVEELLPAAGVAPLPGPALDEPADAFLADPNGDHPAPASAQPEPFTPRRQEPEAPAPNPEEFSI
jgi:Sec-independent protein translocase protein TatA